MTTLTTKVNTDAAVAVWVAALTRDGYVIVHLRAGSYAQAQTRARDATFCEMRDDDRALWYGTN